MIISIMLIIIMIITLKFEVDNGNKYYGSLLISFYLGMYATKIINDINMEYDNNEDEDE
jgi:hypothetical protein